MSESVYARTCHKIGTSKHVVYLNFCKQSTLYEPAGTYLIGLNIYKKKRKLQLTN